MVACYVDGEWFPCMGKPVSPTIHALIDPHGFICCVTILDVAIPYEETIDVVAAVAIAVKGSTSRLQSAKGRGSYPNLPLSEIRRRGRQNLTRSRHSILLTGSRLGPLAPAHMRLGMIDAECLDLNEHINRLALRLSNVLVDRLSHPPSLSKTMARMLAPHDSGPRARCRGRTQVARSASEEVAHCSGDVRGVGLQREVSGIEKSHERTRIVTFERLGTRW